MGQALYGLGLHLHSPPKIFGFVFLEPPPRARNARRAAESVVFFVGGQRKPLRIESCLQTCDSIQPRSNVLYQPLINPARQRRARAPLEDSALARRGRRASSLPALPATVSLTFFFAGGSGRVGQGGAGLAMKTATACGCRNGAILALAGGGYQQRSDVFGVFLGLCA